MPPALGVLLGIATALLVVAWGALGWAARGDVAGVAWMPAAYFVLLGLGFLMVEVLVLQKSLLVIGTPTLNLAVVLCTFLLAAGAGSAVSARLQRVRVLQRLLVLLVIGVFALVWGIEQLHAHAAGWSSVARCLSVGDYREPPRALSRKKHKILCAPLLRHHYIAVQ